MRWQPNHDVYRRPRTARNGSLSVLHAIPSLSPRRGGPSFALPAMAQGLARLGVRVGVITTDDDGPHARTTALSRRTIQREGVVYRYFPRTTATYTSSLGMFRWLSRHAREYDLIHIHALFTYTATFSSLVAATSHVPYIVRPLGTLGSWSIEHRHPRLKRVSFSMVESRIVRHAAAVHYTTEMERREAELLGIRSQGLVIPVPIDAASFSTPPPREAVGRFAAGAAEAPYILYLSRLDRKKGLDLLLPAFAHARLDHPNALLIVAGDGEPGVTSALRRDVYRLGLEKRVVFTGHLAGAHKLAALAHAAAFVLPSYNENFGIAPVEAMAAGTPVILTDRVGISPQVERATSGLVVRPDAMELGDAMSRVLDDESLAKEMGERGRQLVRDLYSLEGVAMALRSAYCEVVR